jgi:glyoxylase-like metal-dependent hydrolase (beta-lactamase superfamily II)
MAQRLFLLMLAASLSRLALAGAATEFCLTGEANLGARYQGMQPGVDEFVPTRWCVVTEDDSQRALFSGHGKSNPDLYGSWTVAALPPDLVRIVNREDPPDIEFHGADAAAEASRFRRIDPRRLLEEHLDTPVADVRIKVEDGRVATLVTSADLPLRGRVPVVWHWDWSDESQPGLTLEVDGDVIFRASGTWRDLSEAEATRAWRPTPDTDPIFVSAENWPARVDMRLVEVADGVHLVRGVRTGFQHLVVETEQGLIVADAPAGWVELHQVPPTDLVPGLGISGLSEKFVDFLAQQFPGQPIRAVALTHAHDDHAGGARAFAAAHAVIFAPAEHTGFLEAALNSNKMPRDRFTAVNGEVDVVPVSDAVTLNDPARTVRLLSIGAGPHASAGLGVHVVDAGLFFVSDLHVPNSDAAVPRSDRARTECWFAAWAVANLPEDTLVVNSHSVPQTPVSRLDEYLQSDACRALQD